jgi:hypothetical protein
MALSMAIITQVRVLLTLLQVTEDQKVRDMVTVRTGKEDSLSMAMTLSKDLWRVEAISAVKVLQGLTLGDWRPRVNLIHSANSTNSLGHRLSTLHSLMDPATRLEHTHTLPTHIPLIDTKDLWTVTHKSYHCHQQDLKGATQWEKRVCQCIAELQ